MSKCIKCENDLEQNTKFCKNCGTKISKKKIENIQTYEGLGGWLILVGIGVVLSPFRLLAELSKTYLPIFENGTWEAITSPSSEHYNKSLEYLLTGEIIFNVLIVLASFYLIYLFFSKKILFPKFIHFNNHN